MSKAVIVFNLESLFDHSDEIELLRQKRKALENFSAATRMAIKRIGKELSAMEDKIKADQNQGLIIKGYDVAAANVNPYFRLVEALRRFRAGKWIGKHRIEQEALSQYENLTDVKFRDETRDVWNFLASPGYQIDVHLIAQQTAQTSQRNLRYNKLYFDQLKISQRDKLALNYNWSHNRSFKGNEWHDLQIPEHLAIPGLTRKPLLRRESYGGEISFLQARNERVIVVGDNFEVDLALPMYMGSEVVLLENGSYSDVERNALEGKVSFVKSPSEAAKYLYHLINIKK